MAKNTLPQKPPARKPLSKRLRFEVFKRDSFKCQYCGAASPSVLLHVDHIHPIAEGGEHDDITNLITACEACNLGKGAKMLSDDSAATKRKAQLDQLQERREQLQMMVEWQRGLVELEHEVTESIASFWSDLAKPYALTAYGAQQLRQLLQKHSPQEVMRAMTEAARGYLQTGLDGQPTAESVNAAWGKVPSICIVNKRCKENPHLKDLYYIRGIVRNRIGGGYFENYRALEWLKAAHSWGLDTDEIKQGVSDVSNWSQFSRAIGILIEIGKRRQQEGI